MGKPWSGRHAQRLLDWCITNRPHICGVCHRPIDVRLRGTRDRMRPSVGHVIPRSRGGSDDVENLRLDHLSCNSSIGNRVAARAPITDHRFFDA